MLRAWWFNTSVSIMTIANARLARKTVKGVGWFGRRRCCCCLCGVRMCRCVVFNHGYIANVIECAGGGRLTVRRRRNHEIK